jgi:hypothetical protein
MKFKDIKLGSRFVHNGTTFTKKSSRTAYITKHRFFYFGLNEEIRPEVFVSDDYYGIPSL